MAEFPYGEALDHARALVWAAEEIEAEVAALRAAQAAALADWLGPHGDAMRDERIPEEIADFERVAIVGLRTEADGWAAAWRDHVDEHNQLRWRQAERWPATVGYGGPDEAPDPPRSAPLPSERDEFRVGPSFVHYDPVEGPDGTLRWSIDYRYVPG